MPPVKAKHARPSLTSILRWKSARPTWWFPKMGVLLDHKFWSDFPLWAVQLLGFICGNRPHEQQMQIIWTYLNLGPRMIWVDFRWWLVLYSSSFGQQIPKHKTSRWWQMFYFLFLPHGHKVTWDSASTRALPIPPAGALRYLPGCRCGGRRCLQISATKISRWDADSAWTTFDSTFMLSVPSMRLFSYSRDTVFQVNLEFLQLSQPSLLGEFPLFCKKLQPAWLRSSWDHIRITTISWLLNTSSVRPNLMIYYRFTHMAILAPVI